MTDTDTDALREKLAETLHYGQGHDDWGVANDDERGEALALADEVLPDLAAEVRKAKAEAWDETCEAFAWCITNGPIKDALPYVAEHNPYRETGGSDEHR